MAYRVQILIIIFYFIVSCRTNPGMNWEKATLLLDKILINYQNGVVPIFENKAVEIKTSIVMNNMLPLEDTPQHFSLDFTLRMVWNDKRLVFNEVNHDVYIPLYAELSKRIWIPSIYFPLGKKGTFHDLLARNVFVFIYGNGTVKFTQRLRILSFCPMNFNFYPFDIQECNFKLSTFPKSSDYVRLNWSDVPIEGSKKNLHIPDYNEVKITTNSTTEAGDFDMTYDVLVVTFILHRDFSAHFIQSYFPCILIVGLSWVSFFVNYKAIPGRVSFGINTFLAIVYMTNSIRLTAPISKNLRSLDYYMLFCMIFVFGVLFEYALVGITDPDFSLSWRIKKKKNLDVSGASESSCEKKVTFGPIVFNTGDQHVIDNCSKIVFPLAFLFFNVLYFVYHNVHPETVKRFTAW
ncbi:glutamate-gated chloride channel isoform X1 [Hydra vulgaris]|uniref:glutamate-gated chloride channel isoform X1 n=2 Tax=Hydra vulgaris TaxID=6087 RepID=UPI001F5FC4E6|nr:glutamate-gated chloride channel isoform X1 [Hydra vulgaris]